MIKRLAAACASAALLSSLTLLPAQANELELYAEFDDGWEVRIDPALGPGCLMQAEFEGGSLFRLGLDVPNDRGYIMSFDESWEGIEEGEEYAITYRLNGDSDYEGTATGLNIAGVNGVEIVFNEIDFLEEISTSSELALLHDGEQQLLIDLSGIDAATLSLIECQGAVSS